MRRRESACSLAPPPSAVFLQIFSLRAVNERTCLQIIGGKKPRQIKLEMKLCFAARHAILFSVHSFSSSLSVRLVFCLLASGERVSQSAEHQT